MAGAKLPAGRIEDVWPLILLGVLLLAAAIGYAIWADWHDKQLAESVGAAELAKPSATECAVARAVIGQLHADGEDAAVARRFGPSGQRMRLRELAISPAGLPGLSDDEVRDAASRGDGDWRWCRGMGSFVRSLGWSRMGTDDDLPELSISLPILNSVGDRATLFEVLAPPAAYGLDRRDRADLQRGATLSWTVWMRRDRPAGAWRLVAREPVVPGGRG
ncbi:MAG: hypothetical protein ACHP84_09920 [Caulobacterales bacterium]